MKNYLMATCWLLFAHVLCIGQNVGIGTQTPLAKLHVNGSLYAFGNTNVGGNIGVGFGPEESANYGLTVQDRSLAIYNSGDNLFWRMHYDPSGNFFQLSTVVAGSTVARMVVTNSGMVGINTTAPQYRLDINGNLKASGDIRSNSSLYLGGNAYVDEDKGLVRASTAAMGNMKIHKANYSVSAILAAHEMSGEFTIAWPSGIFSIAPSVFACNETFTQGSLGELRRVIVKFYDCNTSSCKGRLINTDNAPLNYAIDFDVVMIGR